MIHQTVFTVHRFQKFTSILYSAVVPSSNGMYLKELRCELCKFSLFARNDPSKSQPRPYRMKHVSRTLVCVVATSEAWSLKFLSEEKAV